MPQPLLMPADHREESVDEIHHGGNLTAAQREFPEAPTPWLDLSTGINPIPYPVGTISDAAWTHLPEAAGLTRLQETAAEAYSAKSPLEIVAAPGTQALIQWLPRIFPARRVAIFGFGYQEYPAVWRAAGAQVVITEDFGSLAAPGIDVAVVVNPNNPNGRRIDPRLLCQLAVRLAHQGGTLIVDEAFMDVVRPAASLVPMLPENALVLRSFGKTYGLAGLRLGFAVCAAPVAEELRAAIGPWAVSGPALEIGTTALADKDWLDRTATRLAQDAMRLDTLLRDAGFTFLGGTPLFRLVQHANALPWYQRLGRSGILVRRFLQRPDWLRFGLPGGETDWQRLEAALCS